MGKRTVSELSRIAAEARQQGLSYGQYVALLRDGTVCSRNDAPRSRHAAAPSEPELPDSTTVCAVCGGALPFGRRGGRKYCGEDCRRQAVREYQHRRYLRRCSAPAGLRTCPVCGKCFVPHLDAKCCTRRCSAVLSFRVRQERQEAAAEVK